MSAHSNVTRFGLGSVLVALAVALGGCAESVPAGTASFPAGGPNFGDRNTVVMTRFVATHPTENVVPVTKVATVVTHGEAKRASSVTAMGH